MLMGGGGGGGVEQGRRGLVLTLVAPTLLEHLLPCFHRSGVCGQSQRECWQPARALLEPTACCRPDPALFLCLHV
jgi:hypothetical protein